MVFLFFLFRDIYRSRRVWGREVSMWWKNKKTAARLHVLLSRNFIDMRFLYHPVKPFIVSQRFGENTVCYRVKNGKYEYQGKATKDPCPRGFKSVYSQMKGHNGLDVICDRWQPVYAAASGTVVEVSTEKERGLGVGILTQDGDRFFRHRYWHFMGVNVALGEEVKVGQLIGWAGDTGHATGVHLHLDLKEVTADNKVKNHGNGYFGAIDPAPYLIPKPARGVATLRALLERGALTLDRISDFLRS